MIDEKTSGHPYRDDTLSEGYEDFLASVRGRFAWVAQRSDDVPELRHLFQTRQDLLFKPSAPVNDLFAIFLANLPPGRKQHYTCCACRHFVRRYGGLVTITPDGVQHPAAWPEEHGAPPFFRSAVAALRQAVRTAPVVGVFMTDKTVWGQPETGPWHHLAVVPDARLLRPRTPLKTPGQMAADKLQDFATLKNGLAEYTLDHLRVAKRLLETDALYRAEKSLGVAGWLLDLQERLSVIKNDLHRANIIWLAVAGAPPGWCHPRSTMIGTLLEDIQAGKPFDDIARAFKSKMHPLSYQRPQAPPSEGQIDEAERVIGALKSSGSLERRFAKLEDLQTIWTPKQGQQAPAAAGGVFSHLRQEACASSPLDTGAPPITMTWVKFARDILSKAEAIEYLVPSRDEMYTAMVTGANPESPPILQWDRPELRNQVTQYCYVYGSTPAQWGLAIGEWRKVSGVVLRSNMWDSERSYEHHGYGVNFILEGCRDTRYEVGGGLFVECLRSEYHAIRRTLEAHIARLVIAGKDETPACGLALSKGRMDKWNALFRVTEAGVRSLCLLDRWE